MVQGAPLSDPEEEDPHTTAGRRIESSTRQEDRSWLDGLSAVLRRSRSLGFLGPGGIEAHIENGLTFTSLLPSLQPAGSQAAASLRVLDLGSGGGVPGLVMAVGRGDLEIVLLDAAQRRTDFLAQAVVELGLTDRVAVVRGRAEDAGREAAHRGRFDVVTARSFGPPSVTIECALGFVRGPGSLVLVSEPPDPSGDRWPADRLATLGVRRGSLVRRGATSVQQLEVIEPVPDSIPRRVGVPARRPLF